MVCDAYREIINNDSVVTQHRVKGHWSIIWKLKLPPKVKNLCYLCGMCRAWPDLRVCKQLNGVGPPQDMGLKFCCCLVLDLLELRHLALVLSGCFFGRVFEVPHVYNSDFHLWVYRIYTAPSFYLLKNLK